LHKLPNSEMFKSPDWTSW